MKGLNTVVLSHEAVEQALQDYIDKVFAEEARPIVQTWRLFEPSNRGMGMPVGPPRLELELEEKYAGNG